MPAFRLDRKRHNSVIRAFEQSNLTDHRVPRSFSALAFACRVYFSGGGMRCIRVDESTSYIGRGAMSKRSLIGQVGPRSAMYSLAQLRRNAAFPACHMFPASHSL